MQIPSAKECESYKESQLLFSKLRQGIKFASRFTRPIFTKSLGKIERLNLEWKRRIMGVVKLSLDFYREEECLQARIHEANHSLCCGDTLKYLFCTWNSCTRGWTRNTKTSTRNSFLHWCTKSPSLSLVAFTWMTLCTLQMSTSCFYALSSAEGHPWMQQTLRVLASSCSLAWIYQRLGMGIRNLNVERLRGISCLACGALVSSLIEATPWIVFHTLSSPQSNKAIVSWPFVAIRCVS